MTSADVNDLGYWQPRLYGAGVPTPRTHLVRWRGEPDALLGVLDGHVPPGWDEFTGELAEAGAKVANAYGCWFLRTGHTSGKHQWRYTCHVPDIDRNTVGTHVYALVEHSALVHIMGLPVDVWAARELLPVEHVHALCPKYAGMPVVREYRWFVQVGSGLSDTAVVHTQPYWPLAALHEGGAMLTPQQYGRLCKLEKGGRDELEMWQLARQAAVAATGTDRLCTTWSVDLLATRKGWYVTDMAAAADSYRYDPATQEQL